MTDQKAEVHHSVREAPAITEQKSDDDVICQDLLKCIDSSEDLTRGDLIRKAKILVDFGKLEEAKSILLQVNKNIARPLLGSALDHMFIVTELLIKVGEIETAQKNVMQLEGEYVFSQTQKDPFRFIEFAIEFYPKLEMKTGSLGIYSLLESRLLNEGYSYPQYVELVKKMIQAGLIQGAEDHLKQRELQIKNWLRQPTAATSEERLCQVDKLVHIAECYSMLGNQQNKIKEFGELIRDITVQADSRVQESTELRVIELMSRMPRLGFGEYVEILSRFLNSNYVKKSVWVKISEENKKLGNVELAQEQREYAEDFSTSDTDLDVTNIAHIVATCLEGEGGAQKLFQLVRAQNGLSLEKIKKVILCVCNAGMYNAAEKFIKTDLLKKKGVSGFDVSEIAGYFGNHLSPELWLSLCPYLSKRERLEFLVGGFSYTRKVDMKQVGSYLNFPQELTFESLLPQLIFSLNNEKWAEINQRVLDAAEKLEGSEYSLKQDYLKFLLLGYADHYTVEELLRFLYGLKETVSLNKIDQYRALLMNQEVHEYFSSGQYLPIIDQLAEKQVVSEAKHLLYLDKKTLLRIHEILASLKDQTQQADLFSFLAQVMKQKTTYFSSAVLCIDELKLNVSDPDVKKRMLEAIDGLGGITPTVFKKYQDVEETEKGSFIQGIKSLRQKFYSNSNLTPQELGLSQDAFESILAEYITLLYKPVGMSSEKVFEFIRKIQVESEDRDLAAEIEAVIQPGGEHWDEEKKSYIFDIPLQEVKYRLKEKKKYDPKLPYLTKLLEEDRRNVLGKEKAAQDELRRKALIALARQGDKFEVQVHTVKSSLLKEQHPAVSVLFSFLPAEHIGLLTDLDAAVKSGDASFLYQSLEKVKEIIGSHKDDAYYPGVLAQDTWPKKVREWLQGLDEQLRNDVYKVIGDENLESVCEKLYQLFSKNILARIATFLSKEQKKLEVVKAEEKVISTKKVRFYISKNIPSFFAKASAGICTSEDVELFLREDHFHINMVDDETEEVIGNVQGFIMEIDGKRFLMLRGINPTPRFLTLGNAQGIIDACFALGRELVEHNNLAGLVFSDPLHMWHADSNRPEIRDILRGKYLLAGKEIPLKRPYNIDGGEVQIRQVYPLWNNPNYKAA